MIRRETDAAVINAIGNDPTVRRLMFLGMSYPQEALDFTEAIAKPGAVALVDDGGFTAIFQRSAPGVYECHIMAPKQARGAGAMHSAREMLAYMRDDGASMVWGQPSIHNRAALCFIRRMGLKSAGKGHDPFIGDVEYFVTRDLQCRQ